MYGQPMSDADGVCGRFGLEFVTNITGDFA